MKYSLGHANFCHLAETMQIHNHITPQEYLSHFSAIDNPEMIWRFNVQRSIWENLPIKRAGQRKDFFSRKHDHSLNENVEGPAIPHLNMLRTGKRIDSEGRIAVTQYVAVMLARTERMRLRMAGTLSQDLDRALQDPELIAKKLGFPVGPVRTGLREIEHRIQGDPLRTKEPVLRNVLWLPKVAAHIMQMNWHVVEIGTTDRFVTSDHPVFIDRSIGLKPPSGEFLLAMASNVALIGNWAPPVQDLTFLTADSRLARECNRRIISAAGNWIYCHKRANWVSKVVQNPSTNMSRLAL